MNQMKSLLMSATSTQQAHHGSKDQLVASASCGPRNLFLTNSQEALREELRWGPLSGLTRKGALKGSLLPKLIIGKLSELSGAALPVHVSFSMMSPGWGLHMRVPQA